MRPCVDSGGAPSVCGVVEVGAEARSPFLEDKAVFGDGDGWEEVDLYLSRAIRIPSRAPNKSVWWVRSSCIWTRPTVDGSRAIRYSSMLRVNVSSRARSCKSIRDKKPFMLYLLVDKLVVFRVFTWTATLVFPCLG